LNPYENRQTLRHDRYNNLKYRSGFRDGYNPETGIFDLLPGFIVGKPFIKRRVGRRRLIFSVEVDQLPEGWNLFFVFRITAGSAKSWRSNSNKVISVHPSHAKLSETRKLPVRLIRLAESTYGSL
jgi:hypothetical protein